jgi:hypothetical protein
MFIGENIFENEIKGSTVVTTFILLFINSNSEQIFLNFDRSNKEKFTGNGM